MVQDYKYSSNALKLLPCILEEYLIEIQSIMTSIIL